MIDFELRRDDYIPAPPKHINWGIGIVGMGNIVQGGHLPAYRKCGYRVVACYDLNNETARRGAAEFGIPTVATTLDELLEQPDVDIIDLAVPTQARLPLIEQITRAPRKPRAILSQKPFAFNLADAEQMIALCENAGIVLMVNQQARWAPSHRALKVVIDSDWLGHIYSLTHIIRSNQDEPGSWYVTCPDFTVIDHGIHYFDLLRYFTDRTPIRIKAMTAMMPGQLAIAPMIYSLLCEYPPQDGLMATLHFNNIIPTPKLTTRYEWLVDGTKGSAHMSHGYLALAGKGAQEVQRLPIEGSWWPDAFGGAMGELMHALEEGRVPATSGRDNLSSLKMAFAAVQSSNRG